MQIGTDLAGLDAVIVDRGEQEVGTAQNGGDKENRHHKKGLAFRILQDVVKRGRSSSLPELGLL